MINKIIFRFMAALFSVPTLCWGAKNEEKVVNKAIESMEACLHWGGEVDGDQTEERIQEINAGVKRDCPKAQQHAKQAYAAYPNNPVLSAELIRFVEEGHFKVSEAQMKKLCENAAVHFKEAAAQEALSYSYYQNRCTK